MVYNTQISIEDPQTGQDLFLTPFGSMIAAEETRLFGANFEGAVLSSVFWITTLAGSGAVNLSGAVATLSTGVIANSRALITGTKICRFLSGNTNKYQTGVRLPEAGTTNNVRRWGLFDTNNGMFFELNGTTFQVVTRKLGVDTAVASGSFNGRAGTTYVLDTNFHTYDMVYSGSSVRFYIDRILIHTVLGTTSTWTGTYNLPVAFENVNSGGGTANVSLLTRTVACHRQGYANSRPLYTRISNNTTTTLKTQAGNLHRITINDNGTGSTATIYDSATASGTIIAIVDTSATGSNIEYDVDFNNGLTIVTAGGTPGDLTVVFD